MAKKIMLDAGHFSYVNRSPVFPSYYEGNMTWKLQGYLKKELEGYGFIVDCTRSNRDTDLKLYNRGLKAKGYDLFLSLHSNGHTNTNIDRVVVIKRLDNKDDTLAKALAIEIEKLMQPREAYQIYTKKGANGEYYGVLRGAKAAGVMQAYILEHGFHSNLAGAKFLYNEENLQKIAQVEAQVIARFFGMTKLESSAKTKFLRVLVDELNIHRTSDFKASSVCGALEKGAVATIVKEIEREGTNMYLTKAGYYITASSKYVEIFER